MKQVVKVTFNTTTCATSESVVKSKINAIKARDLADELNEKESLSNDLEIISYLVRNVK